MQQFLDKTAPAQHDADEDETEHPTEPLSRRLEKAFTVRAGWMQALPGAPHTYSRTHVVLRRSFGGGFWCPTQTATFPRPGHSRNYGHVLDPSSPAEVHRWKSATWAATPRRQTWLNDALSSRRSWATTWPTPWRASSADTLECDEARVQFNTHLEQLASCIRKRSHLVNVAAHQVEPAERLPRTRPLQPRPLARLETRTVAPGDHTTHKLTETDNHFHCESCHATVSRERLNS